MQQILLPTWKAPTECVTGISNLVCSKLNIFSSQPATPNVCLLLVNDIILLIILVRNLGLSFPKFTHSSQSFCIYLLSVYHFFPPLHSNCLFLGSGPHHFTLTGCPPHSPTSVQSILCNTVTAGLLKGKSAHTRPLGRYPWSLCSNSCLPLKLSNRKLPRIPRALPQLYFSKQAGIFLYFGICCFPYLKCLFPLTLWHIPYILKDLNQEFSM